MILHLRRYVNNHKLRCFSTTSCSSAEHFTYCSSLVKKRDYENYLCLLLLKGLPRTVGFVSRAVNIELAQIQEATSDVQTAKMRIEFWRKSLNDTFIGRPPSHPVTIALALTLEQKMLSKTHFNKLIDIRERYLSQRPFMTISDVEDYGIYSVAPLYHLLLETLDNTHLDTNVISNAAESLAKASSLVTLIRSVPHFLQERKVFLPSELCHKHSVSQEDIIRNLKQKETAEIICDIASHAKLHLDDLKAVVKTLPKSTRNVFLPIIPNEIFLLHLEKLGFDVYNGNLNRKQWKLPLKLWLAS